MARNYTLKRRADSQAETRRRIVEAAVDLHSTLGPARTTISMIAEKAGVQRHTLYAHFPDERSMLMACSGHALDLDPVPDAAPWRRITDIGERLRVGLAAVYDWYARNESLTACILRDMEVHEIVREIMATRYGPGIHAWGEALGAGLGERQRAVLAVALSFHTWRTLRREVGCTRENAIASMVSAVTA